PAYQAGKGQGRTPMRVISANTETESAQMPKGPIQGDLESPPLDRPRVMGVADAVLGQEEADPGKTCKRGRRAGAKQPLMGTLRRGGTAAPSSPPHARRYEKDCREINSGRVG
ncbi:hypothetical protein EWB00_000902, partial [Schistosoma japonicum]